MLKYTNLLFLQKVIPDLKQQVAELENQKLDLENRLQEQTVKLKGNGPAMVPSLSAVWDELDESPGTELLKAELIFHDDFIALLLTFFLVKQKKCDEKKVLYSL